VVAASLEPQAVIDRAVHGLVEDFGAAFARAWLVGPGDLCDECTMAPSCEDRTRCLHLAASAGLSENLDGEYRRVPFSNLKIGEIGARREGHWTNAVLQDPRVAKKEWSREHQLRCFAGYPLIVDDELLGVLAVFGRERLRAEQFHRLAVFARLTAIALRNARRFTG
jgi:GAF domain-containing protein